MDIGKVLVINDGLSEPRVKMENGVIFHKCGVPDITSGYYSAVVLQWTKGVVIENSTSHASDRIFSTDILRVKVSGVKTLFSGEKDFLLQRILSGNTSDNRRNLALVNPPNKALNSWVRGDIQTLSHKYPHINFYFGSPLECLYGITEEGIFDTISLFHNIGEYYPKFLGKKRTINEDSKIYLHRNTGYIGKKSPDFLSTKEGFQTVFPHALINKFSDGCTRHHIECLKVHIAPKLNIPDFLDKCPKV